MIPSEDTRRKLVSSVLLVGGGLALRGAAAYLQSRLGPGAQVDKKILLQISSVCMNGYLRGGGLFFFFGGGL